MVWQVGRASQRLWQHSWNFHFRQGKCLVSDILAFQIISPSTRRLVSSLSLLFAPYPCLCPSVPRNSLSLRFVGSSACVPCSIVQSGPPVCSVTNVVGRLSQCSIAHSVMRCCFGDVGLGSVSAVCCCVLYVSLLCVSSTSCPCLVFDQAWVRSEASVLASALVQLLGGSSCVVRVGSLVLFIFLVMLTYLFISTWIDVPTCGGWRQSKVGWSARSKWSERPKSARRRADVWYPVFV